MATITFTIPSVLNGGGGEKKTDVSASTLNDAFAKFLKQWAMILSDAF